MCYETEKVTNDKIVTYFKGVHVLQTMKGKVINIDTDFQVVSI